MSKRKSLVEQFRRMTPHCKQMFMDDIAELLSPRCLFCRHATDNYSHDGELVECKLHAVMVPCDRPASECCDYEQQRSDSDV